MKIIIAVLEDSEFEYQKSLVDDYDLCSATSSTQAYIGPVSYIKFCQSG